MTQHHLAGLLQLSQSRLSEIECGQGSFSAEQFLRILRTFNVPVSRFDRGPRDVGDSLQKALARLAAAHLVEDPDVLPSEQLENVEAVIRETLVEGGAARALTALAPVLINHLNRVNLSKLFAQFKDYGLERRFGWLIENIIRAGQVARKPGATSLQGIVHGGLARNDCGAQADRGGPGEGAEAVQCYWAGRFQE